VKIRVSSSFDFKTDMNRLKRSVDSQPELLTPYNYPDRLTRITVVAKRD